MKRLTIALLLLASCHQPQDEYAPCTYLYIQPLNLLYPEEFYRIESPVVKDILPSWLNQPEWYASALKDHGRHGRIRIGYADKFHAGFPDIFTTADSVRYYDSVVGYPSSAILPAEGALSDK